MSTVTESVAPVAVVPAVMPVPGIPTVPAATVAVTAFRCSGMTAGKKQCNRGVAAEGARCWQHPVNPAPKPAKAPKTAKNVHTPIVVTGTAPATSAPAVLPVVTVPVDITVAAPPVAVAAVVVNPGWINTATIDGKVSINPRYRSKSAFDMTSYPAAGEKWMTGPLVLKVQVGDHEGVSTFKINFKDERDYTLSEVLSNVFTLFEAPLSLSAIDKYIENATTANEGNPVSDEDMLHELATMVEEEGYVAHNYDLHFKNTVIDRITKDINEDAKANEYVLLLKSE